MNINPALFGIPISEEQCIGDSLAYINTAFLELSSAVATKIPNEAQRIYLAKADFVGYVKNTGDTVNGTLQIGSSTTANTAAKLALGKTSATTSGTVLPTIYCSTYDGIGNDLYISSPSNNGKILFKVGPGETEVMRVDSRTGGVGINAIGETPESPLDVFGGVSIKADSGGNALFISKNGGKTTGAVYDRFECKMDINNPWVILGTNNVGAGTAPRGVAFQTGGSQHLYISTTGNVGVGTASPTQKLHVAGNIQTTGNIVSTGGGLSVAGEIANSVGGLSIVGTTTLNGNTSVTGTIGATGKISNTAGGLGIVGLTTLNGNTSVTGTIAATGNISSQGDVIAFSSSDIALKKNIQPITDALEKVCNIGGYKFEWDNQKAEHLSGIDVGVIAQEIEKVLPEVVNTRDNGYKAVKYEKIIPLLIEAIKDLKQEIQELKYTRVKS